MNGTRFNITNNLTGTEDGMAFGFGHSLNPTFSVIIATYFMLIILGGIVFNTILVYTISTKTRLHTISNYFIVNLAVCDLLTAISTLPFDSDFLLRGYYDHGNFVCGMKETAFMFSLPSAILNLLLLTSERFITILFPFHHEKLFTKKNVVILLIASWTYFLLVAFFPLIYDTNAVIVWSGKCFVVYPIQYVFYQLFGNFATPFFTILVMNCLIYRIASKHARCIRKQRSSVCSKSNAKKKVFNANFKAAKTIMVLVGNVFICWLTYIAIVTYNVFCGLCLPREATWVGNAINYTSIAANPMIYGLLNKRIRNIIFKEYTCFFFRQKENRSRKLTPATAVESFALTQTEVMLSSKL